MSHILVTTFKNMVVVHMMSFKLFNKFEYFLDTSVTRNDKI